MIPKNTPQALLQKLTTDAEWHYRRLFPGIMVAVLVALSAQFLADHYQTPAMLLALLLGIALGFLGEEGKAVEGIQFASRTLLRAGVALLGIRISVTLLSGLGVDMIALVIASMIATIALGLSISRWFGHKWRFALLTSGSVAICGASAAIAISAILPKDERSEERLAFTVMGVTVLSTLAMIVYPIITQALELDDFAAGYFIGGTIHDVAQVVGAGFTVSPQAGEAATLVKLIRVAMLGPIVIIASLAIRRFASADQSATRQPLLPGFVIVFLILAAISSAGWVPQALSDTTATISGWLLLTAIAAVGMRTNLKQVLSVGGPAIALLFVETVFIAGFVLAGIYLLH